MNNIRNFVIMAKLPLVAEITKLHQFVFIDARGYNG